ncbi:MAG: hypothetical protein ACO1TE_14425 [Prosthecobacter sp.]
MNLLHLDLPPLVARVNSNAAATRLDAAANIQRPTIAERLQELEDEWTIEGLFETSAAVVGVATLAVGLAVDDRWLVLPLIVSVLLLQQTLQGWCPLLPLLRGLGFRTEREVHDERHLLQQMEEEERAGCHSPIWLKTESPSLPNPASAQSGFSLQDFLLASAR